MVLSSDAAAPPAPHLKLLTEKGRKHVEVKGRMMTPVVHHAVHARARSRPEMEPDGDKKNLLRFFGSA